MDGNSKLLALVAIGVIGIGSAMPYWSSDSVETEEARQVSASDKDLTTTVVKKPPIDEASFANVPADEPRPVVLAPSRSMAHAGLDERMTMPTLSAGMENPVSGFQASYQQGGGGATSGVTLATRVQQLENRPDAVPRVSIPIAIESPATDRSVRMTPLHSQRSSESEEANWQPRQSQESSRSAPPRTFAPQAESQQGQHRIVDGDSLESLAQRYLGDPGLAGALFRANRDVLSDPELLPIGKQITIPRAEDLSRLETEAGERPTTPVRPLMAQPASGDESPWTNLKPLESRRSHL
ncbi:MAG: LysM peptidoglycan-binding domain-containing protein [Pirellulaceae bacterium]